MRADYLGSKHVKSRSDVRLQIRTPACRGTSLALLKQFPFPKRQRTGAVQDASRIHGRLELAPAFGLRQSSGAFRWRLHVAKADTCRQIGRPKEITREDDLCHRQRVRQDANVVAMKIPARDLTVAA